MILMNPKVNWIELNKIKLSLIELMKYFNSWLVIVWIKHELDELKCHQEGHPMQLLTMWAVESLQ